MNHISVDMLHKLIQSMRRQSGQGTSNIPPRQIAQALLFCSEKASATLQHCPPYPYQCQAACLRHQCAEHLAHCLGGTHSVIVRRMLPREWERWHNRRIRGLLSFRHQRPQRLDIASHSLQLQLHIREHRTLLRQIVLMFLDQFQVILLLLLQIIFSLHSLNSSCSRSLTRSSFRGGA